MHLSALQTDNLEKLKVYVCYRGNQKRIARDLVEGLKATKCVDTFFDEEDLSAGAELPENLALEINDSDYFLAVISNDMFNSVWVKMEIDEAVRRSKSIKREFIIPILLLGVDQLSLPEPLNNISSDLKLIEDKPDQVQMLNDRIMKSLFQLVGKHFRGKSKRKTSIGAEAKDGLASTRRLADLDFPSLEAFYHSCKVANSGTFFNVQISSDEWFAPNLQIHLAIQEGMAQCIRWTTDLPASGGVISDSHMPFRRVSFVANTRNELIADFELAKPSAKHLCALMHIHNLMACPLAIVTVDDLAQIIVSNFDFFSSAAVEKVIGIPNSIVQIANPANRNNAGWFFELRKKLQNLIKYQASDTPGVVEPSMDFAIFRYQKNGDSRSSIWGGKVASDGAIVYFEIPNEYDMKKTKFPPELDGITFKSYASPSDNYRILQDFSNIVEGHVFVDRNNPSEIELTEKELDYLKAFFLLNPVASSLGIDREPNLAQFSKVRRKYCPWMLLHDFATTTAGMYQTSIKSVQQGQRNGQGVRFS